MNNPDNIEIDIDEQRVWLMEHKAQNGLSWTQLAAPLGVPYGTLSTFGTGSYKGDNDRIAREVYRYRQTLQMQNQLRNDSPDIPKYFETRTSRELMNLLSWAQRGRMTVCAGGPGIGKTSSAIEYKERASNVWLVTCRPSMKSSVSPLTRITLQAMGDFSSHGSSAQQSTYIMSRLRNSNGLLIFDDAQHLTIEHIEEIRGWYDQTGVGIAFLGNEDVVARMEGGARKAAFAQLYSRVGMKMIRPLPLTDDAEALALEWKVEQEEIVKYIRMIASKPGGLRSCTFALEVANIVARSEGSDLQLKHLMAAWAQLTARPVLS